jgi:hypothetical protein
LNKNAWSREEEIAVITFSKSPAAFSEPGRSHRPNIHVYEEKEKRKGGQQPQTGRPD